MDHVRPLCIGAPLTSRFEAVSPIGWNLTWVRANLFEMYDMAAEGWQPATIRITWTYDHPSGGRYWLIERD